MTGLIVVLLLAAMIIGYLGYSVLYRPNVKLTGQTAAYLYIPTGSNFGDVQRILNGNHFLRNQRSFRWVAIRKHYDKRVKPGRYLISDGMSNNTLVNLLRAGKQEPVKLTFQNIRSEEDFAGRISRQIEADSLKLLKLLGDEQYLAQFGIKPATSFVLFIPNTYEFYWNTSADQFMQRMYREHKKFWNGYRADKAHSILMTINEVVTLASIVEKETATDLEKPVIAGVYMNRLQKGWPLQADPTLIFAWNDYSIRRVLDKHKKIESPYNTYQHTGLPPGPICLPSVSSIDAVLNYRKHNYMFFCAKDDLSGNHVFAETLDQHNRNAKKYHAVIRKLNIR